MERDSIRLWDHSLDITLWKLILINSGHLDQHLIQCSQPPISGQLSARWPQNQMFQNAISIDMYIEKYIFEHADYEYDG